MIPLITKNHIYTGIVGYDQPRSDFRDYVDLIKEWAGGNYLGQQLYPARQIIGYPIAWLHNLTGISIDAIYITFCFLALAGTGLIIYYIFNKYNAGIYALVIAVFCSTGILAMFSYGMIINIINMYAILLSAIYLGLQWLENRRHLLLIGSLALFGLFSAFHPTSLYLPYMAITIVGIILTLKVFKRNIRIDMPIKFISLITAINILVTGLIYKPALSNSGIDNIKAVIDGVQTKQLSNIPLNVSFFASQYLTLSVLGLLIVAGVYLVRSKKLVLSNSIKKLAIVLICMAIPLGVGTFTRLSPEPVRTAVDFATISALLVALIIGNIKKTILLRTITYSLVGYGALVNLAVWVR